MISMAATFFLTGFSAWRLLNVPAAPQLRNE
jgi:hypothetical protein